MFFHLLGRGYKIRGRADHEVAERIRRYCQKWERDSKASDDAKIKGLGAASSITLGESERTLDVDAAEGEGAIIGQSFGSFGSHDE